VRRWPLRRGRTSAAGPVCPPVGSGSGGGAICSAARLPTPRLTWVGRSAVTAIWEWPLGDHLQCDASGYGVDAAGRRTPYCPRTQVATEGHYSLGSDNALTYLSALARTPLSAAPLVSCGVWRPPSPRPRTTHERPILRTLLSGIPRGRQTARRRCRHSCSARKRRRRRNLRGLLRVASAAQSAGTVLFPPQDA